MLITCDGTENSTPHTPPARVGLWVVGAPQGRSVSCHETVQLFSGNTEYFFKHQSPRECSRTINHSTTDSSKTNKAAGDGTPGKCLVLLIRKQVSVRGELCFTPYLWGRPEPAQERLHQS